MTENRRSPETSPPWTRAFPGDSPIQHAVRWFGEFFRRTPEPNLQAPAAKTNGMLCGTHLLHLLQGAGLLNGAGFHSAAISLLRPMEDALDCYAAIILVPGAAQEWEARRLKASDAGRRWVPLVADLLPAEGISLDDYRKQLREAFNPYAHCSYDLCIWNLFFLPHTSRTSTGNVGGTIELNLDPSHIDRNGHAIDAFETAHLLEFLAVTQRGYSSYLNANTDVRTSLADIVPKIEQIMKQHHAHRCQEVRIPPELAKLDR